MAPKIWWAGCSLSIFQNSTQCNVLKVYLMEFFDRWDWVGKRIYIGYNSWVHVECSRPGSNDEPGIKTNFEQIFFSKITDAF